MGVSRSQYYSDTPTTILINSHRYFAVIHVTETWVGETIARRGTMNCRILQLIQCWGDGVGGRRCSRYLELQMRAVLWWICNNQPLDTNWYELNRLSASPSTSHVGYIASHVNVFPVTLFSVENVRRRHENPIPWRPLREKEVSRRLKKAYE